MMTDNKMNLASLLIIFLFMFTILSISVVAGEEPPDGDVLRSSEGTLYVRDSGGDYHAYLAVTNDWQRLGGTLSDETMEDLSVVGTYSAQGGWEAAEGGPDSIPGAVTPGDAGDAETPADTAAPADPAAPGAAPAPHAGEAGGDGDGETGGDQPPGASTEISPELRQAALDLGIDEQRINGLTQAEVVSIVQEEREHLVHDAHLYGVDTMDYVEVERDGEYVTVQELRPPSEIRADIQSQIADVARTHGITGSESEVLERVQVVLQAEALGIPTPQSQAQWDSNSDVYQDMSAQLQLHADAVRAGVDPARFARSEPPEPPSIQPSFAGEGQVATHDGQTWMSTTNPDTMEHEWVCVDCGTPAAGLTPPPLTPEGDGVDVVGDFTTTEHGGETYDWTFGADGNWHCTSDNCRSGEQTTATGGFDWTDEDDVAALGREVERRNELIRDLAGQTNQWNQPVTAESVRENHYSVQELDTMYNRRNNLLSMTGNPNEINTRCSESDCGSGYLTVNEDGRLTVVFPEQDAPGTEEGETSPTRTGLDFVVTDYDAWDEDGNLLTGDACGEDGCSGAELLCEGCALVDDEGRRWISRGPQFVDEDGDVIEGIDSAEECARRSGCTVEHQGMEDEQTHYYWAPRTWSDFLTSGGPAVQAYRSISSLIPRDVGYLPYTTKARAYLDRYFNLDQWTQIDACQPQLAGVYDNGVALSPYGSGIPTAMIQGHRFKVSPCAALEGISDEAYANCVANLSFESGNDYYYVYRLTGKVIPKDCDMEFNIVLYGDAHPEGKVVYSEPRIAEQGAPPFDFTGANALVTSSKTHPLYETVCIKFYGEDMGICFRTEEYSWDEDYEVCNTIAEGDEGENIQTVVVDEETGEVITDIDEDDDDDDDAPTTSSTTEGTVW